MVPRGMETQHKLAGVEGSRSCPPTLLGHAHRSACADLNGQCGHKNTYKSRKRHLVPVSHGRGRAVDELGREIHAFSKSGTHLQLNQRSGGLVEQDTIGSIGMASSSGPISGDSAYQSLTCSPGRRTHSFRGFSLGFRAQGRKDAMPSGAHGLRVCISPLPLILRVIRKLLAERAELLLVAPHWPRRPWCADLVSLSDPGGFLRAGFLSARGSYSIWSPSGSS